MALWTGALGKPITGYTPPKTATTTGGIAGISHPVSNGTVTVRAGATPGYYGQSYTKTNYGEVDNATLQDYVAKYGDEARDVVLDYYNNKDNFSQGPQVADNKLKDYMENWWNSRQKATTKAPAETTSAPASTSAVQKPTDAATNSQADALSNNVNEGENRAKQTMTVQSGSDMGGVNYTNAGGKSATATTSSDDVMPQEGPTNQKYNSWMQNASTFGTSDENEKRSPEGSLKQPLTLTKTVYWKSRRKK